MTIRDVLRKKKRTYFGIAIGSLVAGMLAFQGSMFTTATWLAYPAALLGLSTVAAAMAYRFAVRCPCCRGHIGYSHSHFGRRQVLGRAVSHCPFCGVSLDVEPET